MSGAGGSGGRFPPFLQTANFSVQEDSAGLSIYNRNNSAKLWAITALGVVSQLGGIAPSADSTDTLGTALLRWLSAASVEWDCYNATTDTNPSASLVNGGLKSAPSNTAYDESLLHTSVFTGTLSAWLFQAVAAAGARTDVVIAPSAGAAPTVGGSLTIARVADITTNYEFLQLYADVTNSLFVIATNKGGSGVVRPLSIQPSGVESLRFLANGNLQFSTVSLLGTYTLGGTITLTAGSWAGLITQPMLAVGSGIQVLLTDQETQQNHTVNNADTDITTIALAANTFSFVKVEVDGYVSVTATSTLQQVNLKIKDGATQKGNTMLQRDVSAAISIFPFHFSAIFLEQSAVTIHITEGAAATDANTTVFINRVTTYGIA